MKFSLFRGGKHKISGNVVFFSVYGSEFYNIASLDRKYKIIEKNVKDFEKLLNGKDELNDKDFAKIYAKFYHPNTHLINLLTTDDKIFSNPKGFKLKSNDLIFREKNPSPNSSGIYGEYFYANYFVIAEKDFKPKEAKYSKEEIAKLAKDGVIAVVDKVPSNEVAFNLSHQKEGDREIIKLSKIKVPFASANYPTYDLLQEDVEEFLLMYPKVLKMIRKDLDEESLKNNYKVVLKSFGERKEELNHLLKKVVSGNSRRREKTFEAKYESESDSEDL